MALPAVEAPAVEREADSPSERLEVVDENNQVVGTELRGLIHQRGLIHRAVHVIVFDSGGDIILQRRSPGKKLGPNLWDFSCAEHVSIGESYDCAAARGLREELSINLKDNHLDVQFHAPRLQRMSYREVDIYDNEFVVRFGARYDGDVDPDPVEVAEVRRCSIDELSKEVVEHPERFTPWMLHDLEVVPLARLRDAIFNPKI